MNPIEQRLRSMGKDYITVADMLYAGLGADLAQCTSYLRISKLKGEDSPESFGGFRAGGTLAFTVDAGVEYAKHLEKLWADKPGRRAL